LNSITKATEDALLKQDAMRWRQLLKDRCTKEWTTALHAYVSDEWLGIAADKAIKGDSI
jgi:hypothetical protein